MPPFAHACDVQILVDASLEAFSSETGGLYCGSGSAHGIVILTFKQLLDLSGGRVVDITLDTTGAADSEGGGQDGPHKESTRNSSENSILNTGLDSEVSSRK